MTAYVEFALANGIRTVKGVKWGALLQGETGDSFPIGSFSDSSVQVTGTFGGATVTIEGSNDNVNFFTLVDPQGNNLSFTSAKLEAVLEMVLWIRPKVTGGDGTTDIDVTMGMKVV